MAADPAIRWNTLLLGLHAATILGQANSKGTAFVHSAEDLIVPGHSAHWLTYFLSLREQQCNPFKSLPGWHTAVALSASHVTRGRAYYRATVDTDMYASVASSSTRLEIAPPRLTPHFTNRVSRPGSTRCNQQCTHKQSTSLWK